MKVGRFVSSCLKATDLPRPVVITIERVQTQVFESDGEQEEKLILFAKNGTRGIALSRTAINQLVAIFASDDSDDWIGGRVVVFNDPAVEFQGRRVGGIRFRAADGAPARAAPPAPAAAEAPPAEPGEQWPPGGAEVPF